MSRAHHPQVRTHINNDPVSIGGQSNFVGAFHYAGRQWWSDNGNADALGESGFENRDHNFARLEIYNVNILPPFTSNLGWQSNFRPRSASIRYKVLSLIGSGTMTVEFFNEDFGSRMLQLTGLPVVVGQQETLFKQRLDFSGGEDIGNFRMEIVGSVTSAEIELTDIKFFG